MHCKGLKRVQIHKLSDLPLICACWLSGAISPKRLSVWLWKRSPMNLDILSIMRVLESLHLANGGKRNQLAKWRVMRCHNCRVQCLGRFKSFQLSLAFLSFVFPLACNFSLIMLSFECKVFKRLVMDQPWNQVEILWKRSSLTPYVCLFLLISSFGSARVVFKKPLWFS